MYADLDGLNPFQEPDQDLIDAITDGAYLDGPGELLINPAFSDLEHLAHIDIPRPLKADEWQELMGMSPRTFTLLWEAHRLNEVPREGRNLVLRPTRPAARAPSSEPSDVPNRRRAPSVEGGGPGVGSPGARGTGRWDKVLNPPPRQPVKKQIVTFDELEEQVERQRKIAQRERRRNVVGEA